MGFSVPGNPTAILNIRTTLRYLMNPGGIFFKYEETRGVLLNGWGYFKEIMRQSMKQPAATASSQISAQYRADTKTETIVYKATVETPESTRKYIGSTDLTFKKKILWPHHGLCQPTHRREQRHCAINILLESGGQGAHTHYQMENPQQMLKIQNGLKEM